MDANEAQDRMQEIQRIMERATLFTLLPGTPAVVGGLMVLAGCGVSYAMVRSLDFADLLHVSVNGQIAFCVMWFPIGVIGVLLEVVLTTRAATRQQLVPADRPMRVAAFSLTPSVVVAMVLTVKFLLPVDPKVWDMLWTWNFNVPLDAQGRGNPVHRAHLDDALRHRSLHGGPVLDSTAPHSWLDVHWHGHHCLVVFPAIRRCRGGAVVWPAAHRFRAVYPPQATAGGGPMNEPVKPDDIDAIIHERVRLSIVAALAVSPQLSFNELKSMLGLTDGNLSAHSRTLEEAGYIVVEKSFRGRRPYTEMRLTRQGAQGLRALPGDVAADCRTEETTPGTTS